MAMEQIARQKIEVKMSMQDSNQLYDLAEQLGMSVSAVVQDVMHKYLGGDLVEKT
jgi:hypothetical protein